MDELIRYQHSFPRFASDWLNSLKTKLPELKELVEAKGTRYDSNRPETSLAASDAPGASQSSTDVAKAGGDAKAIRAALREEHPDWDSRRVATVASKMEKDNRASAASSAVEAAEASTPAASEAPTKRAKPDSLKRLEKQIREGANPKNLWSWVRDNPDAPEELKDLVVQARNNDTRPTPADNSAAARRDDKLVRDTVNAYYSPKAAAVDTSAVNQTTGPGVEFDALKNADETGALAELELPEGWTVSVHRKSGWPDRYGLTDESGVDVAYSKSDGRWYPTSSEINPLDLPNNDEGVDADDLNSRIQSSTAAVDAPAETGYFSDLPSGTLETVPDLESPAIAEHSSDLAGYRRISGTEINSLRGEDEFFSRPPLMYGEGTFLVGPEGTVIESTTYNLPDGSKKPGFRVRFQRDGDTFELAMSPEELELSKDQQLKLAKGLALQKAIELREGNSASAPDATNASDEPDAPTADASSVDPVAAHQAAMGEVDTEQRSLDQLKDELRGLQSRNAPQSTIDSMLKTIEERQAKLNDLIEQENAAAAVRREFDEEQWQERVAGLDKAGLLKEYRNLDEDRVRQQNARTPDRAKERQIEARMRQVNDLLNSVSGANGQGVSDAPASGSGSAVEMLRKGADGKAVRDQLRQENPGATNRQIWAIYNAMVKRNEGTLSVDSTQKLITVTPGQWARKGKATMAAKRRVVLAGGGSDQFVRKGDLDRSPKSNWVEEQGGLPEYIGEVADALHRKGMNISRAIATAVNTIKRWARGGPAAQGQKGSVSKATQAKAIKALAEWETKRAAARASRLEAGMTFATIDVHGNWHHPHTGEYIHKPWDLDLDLKNLLTPEERAELSVSAGMDASAVHNALYNLRKTFRTMKGGVTPQQMDVAWGQIATLRDAWSLGALKREDGKPWSEEAIAAFEKVDQMIDRAEASLEYMETQFLESEIGFDNPVDDQVPDETPEIDLDAPTAELRRLLSAGLTAREVAMIQEELQTRRTDESQVESLINVKRAEIEAERAFPQDPGLPRGLRVEDRELIQQAVASHLGEIDLDKPGTIVPVNDKTFTDRWIVTNEAGVKGYVEHDGPNRIVFTPFDATASDPLVHLGRQEPAVIADRILNGDFDYDPETGQLLEAGEPVLTLDEKKRGRVNGVLAKSPGFVPAQAELEHRPVHEGFPDSGEAYDASQWRDDIKDGDTLVTQDGKVAVLVKAWPIAVTEDNGHFHKLLVPLREFLAQPENAEYAGAFADAKSRGLVTITLDSEPTASTELPSRNGGYHEDNEPGMYREPGWDEEWAVNRAVLASGAKNELAAPIKPPAEWFANPNLTEATPLTITKDGRVFGHVATWGVCHTASMGNDCVMVPSSKTDYAMFHLGVVETAEGTEVPVGRITMRTGHASEYANARKALAHYENTGQAVADVHAGEDAFGVWIAGALRPDVTPEQLRALKSSPLSGDWRYLASTGSLEMLMVLAVNMPGFPVPRPKGLVASGALRSLTSAGMVAPKKVPAEKVQAAMAGDTLAADDIRYLQKLARQAKQAEAEALKLQVAKVTMLPGISEMAQRLAAERRVREMAASLRKKERI
jgi:hypothetical protein